MKGYCQSCLIWNDLDKAHIKSKGSGGSKDEDNIILFCRPCHQLQHQLGWAKFLEQKPIAFQNVTKKGWAIKSFFGIKKMSRVK